MATVTMDGIGKRFPGGAVALEGINLAVGDGELLVVVGPSGCGKSTLLRIVAGLESATEGTLRIDGRPVDDLPPQERNVAMVFQDYSLYPFLTVRENLAFPLKMRRLSRSEQQRRVEEIAVLLDLQPLLDRLPRQLSGGQRQRVAMGRALVREPSVSLLDEPLSNLDARLRVQVRAELGELQARLRTTMIYVTHDQVEAMTLGHRVAVLGGGRLHQVAAPADLYDHPANTFVAGFLGSPPMNLVPARSKVGTLRFAVGPHELALPEDPPPPPEFILGVRPESLALSEPGEGALPAQVEHVEFLGHETLLHVHLAGLEGAAWIARLPGIHPFRRGDSVALRPDPHRLVLFDPEGRALPRKPGSR